MGGNRAAVVVAAAIVIAVGGVWAYRQFAAAGPPPEIVVPATLELLDPDVRELVRRSVAAASAEPQAAELHGRLGMVYEANALWTEAHDSYAIAARLEPDDRLWSYHLAIATQQLGDFSEALRMYRTLSAEEPGFAPLSERLAWALLDDGDLGAALDAFNSVIESEPDRPHGYVGAATVLRLQGRPADAVGRLERALKLEPDHRAARYQLGLAYRDLGRRQEAERELSMGIQAKVHFLSDPLSDEIAGYSVGLAARLERAEALRRAGRFEELTRLFEEALATRPDNLTVLNGLAATYLSRNEFARAREILSRALEVDGANAETHLNLAGWALATNQPARALEYADLALKVAPRLARLHAVRAQALIAERRYGEAIPSLEEAIRLEVRDPALYLVLGVLYSETGRWERAREVYDSALASWPDLVPALLGRGEASLALGDPVAAGESLERLERLAPSEPRLAELRRALGARSGTGG